MSVRTTMPPMPPMGGMPGMPMGGMGMAPPAPMGGSMAPMGAPMQPPMPAPMQAPSASAGTLPSPSSAGQRAGFRQFSGAIQNMRASAPPMGGAPMGPMGSMPQNIFAPPMGSQAPGGMPVPALPGRMSDVGRRAVGMKDGGLAGVAYMQGGGDPVRPDVNQYARGTRPNMKEFMDRTGVDAGTASQILYGSVGSNVDIRDWNQIMSSQNPLNAAQAATAQMYTSGARYATDPDFYDPDTGAYNPMARTAGAQQISGAPRLQMVGNQVMIVDSQGLPLTGLTPQNAAAFGITQSEIDAAIESGAIRSDQVRSYLEAGHDPTGYSGYENLLVDYSNLGAPVSSTPVTSGTGTSGTSGTGVTGGGGTQTGAIYGGGAGAGAGSGAGAVPVGTGTGAIGMAPGTSLGIASPYGAVYQPMVYDVPRFVRGIGDLYGTRPVSYVGPPEASLSGPLGSINLPARPEQVNVFDWLNESVLGGSGASSLYRPFMYEEGGEVGRPFDPPRRTDIRGQNHMLAYITPDEAGILKALGGTGEAGPMGIPSYPEPGYGSGGMGDPAGPSGGGQSSGSSAGTGGGGADSGQAAAAADAGVGGDGPGFDAFGNEYGSAAEAAVADAVAEAAAEAANAAMGQSGTGGYGADAAAAVADALGLGPSGPSAQTSAPSQPSMSVVDQLSTMVSPSQPADISLVDPMTMSQFAPTRGQIVSAPTAPDTTPSVSMSPASITAMSDIANMVTPENVDDPLGLMSTPAIGLTAPENDPIASTGTGTSQMSVSPAAISDIFAEDVAMSQTVAPALTGGLSSVAPSMDTAPTGLFSAPSPSAQTDISQPSMPSSFAPAPVAPPSSYGPPSILSVDIAPVSAPTVDVAPTGLFSTPSTAPSIATGIDRGLAEAAAQSVVSNTVDAFGTMNPSAVADVANELGLSVDQVQSMVDQAMSDQGLTAPATGPSTSVSTTSQATNVSPETITEDLAPTTTTPSTTTQTTMTTRPNIRPDVNLSLKDQIDMALTNLTGTLTGKTQEQINEELGKKGYTPAEISMFNAKSTNTQRGVADAVENQIGAGDEILNKVVTDTDTDTEEETDGEEVEKVPFSTGEPYVPETLEEIMARITSPTTLGRRLNVTSGGPNVFFPSGSSPVRMQDGGEPNYRRMARDFATEYGVDPDIFTKLVIRESGFNPNARSRKGAFGLTQVMPHTARKPGFGVKPLENMSDPRDQLRFGAEYLSAMLKEFGGDYPQALAAYNAGVGAVRDAGGVPDFKETREYVDYILGTTRPQARPGSVSPAPEGVTRPRVRPENLADLLASLERPRTPSRSLRPQMRPSPTISSQDRFAQLDAAASGKDSLGMAVDSFLKSMAAE